MEVIQKQAAMAANLQQLGAAVIIQAAALVLGVGLAVLGGLRVAVALALQAESGGGTEAAMWALVDQMWMDHLTAVFYGVTALWVLAAVALVVCLVRTMPNFWRGSDSPQFKPIPETQGRNLDQFFL